ncbi:MAG: hypothetical protein LBD81_02770 [Holosporaceae bacterium]|jgi:chromosomal replication initiation ATPase DnaA|nr:hypothetical protein [Holosporaceae bacterium]
MIQEVFDFHKTEKLSWNDFINSEENGDAIRCLMQWPRWDSNGIVIYGNAGVGKTHLANLWAQTAGAVYVIKQSLDHDPRTLFDADCNFIIDNFENFLTEKNNPWIFHFFNIAAEKKRSFMLLSRSRPFAWQIELKDLRSRLLTLPAINILDPQDELLFKIAKKLARDLEITVGDDALKYLINVVDRSAPSVSAALRILDKMALQMRKNITTSFVKRYIAGVTG